jgi:hypothetical protein
VDGASALQQVLLEHKEKKLEVFVLWEPVLDSDLGPPSEENKARVSDPRAKQYWDQKLLFSNEVMALTNKYPERFSEEHKKEVAKRNLIWDAVLIFKPGARWEEMLPFPDYSAGPVLDVVKPFSEALSQF